MNFNNLNVRNAPGSTCSKSGIKIHETPPSYNRNDNNYDNRNINSNSSNSSNSNSREIYRQIHAKSNVKTPVNFHNTSLNNLDLDLEHYSLEDLYNLFNIQGRQLDEDILRTAKQIVYKMHPDKSQLDPKYFRFFSNAYKRIYNIYEFQNKSTNKKIVGEDYYEDSNRDVLNHMFETNKTLKDPKNFNNWFNEKFEKHKTSDSVADDNGYGNWLKSDEGLYSVNENITKSNMNEAFERQKKQIQSLTVYNGISDSFSSFSGSLLDSESTNYSGSMGSNLGYTDLRQAHMESVIPVTQEDFDRMQKFNSISEYKAKRDSVDTTPLSKQESERILMRQGRQLEEQSAALAYKYAQQVEKSKKQNQSFFSDIKQLTGW
jgi:hypothetical protein